MALVQILQPGPTLRERGQGAAEAVLALPVFLVLTCLIFQLFFLAIARIGLHYAAFCAARVGSVRDGDPEEMKKAVIRILGAAMGRNALLPGSVELEILEEEVVREQQQGTAPARPAKPLLSVRVHWRYPLLVPFADRILARGKDPVVSGVPTVHLHAAWTMNRSPLSSRGKTNAEER